MKKLKYKLIALLVVIYRKKFRALYFYLLDKDYRTDINYLIGIKATTKLKRIPVKVVLDDIRPSHRVIYRNWVRHLVQLYTANPKAYEPIEIYEFAPGRYMPMDGNHRLAALNMIYSRADSITAFLMVPTGPSENGNVHMNTEPVVPEWIMEEINSVLEK